ncbi:MAG TPA: ankyrin repeat domain-containing protein [Bryobacteraceae bacterium]|nr:ankyrin repeat domain-containing protein [Bryobacteraceae bacterium]
MSSDPQGTPRPLPDPPDLRHLKDQARDLLETGAAASITGAQFKIARLYGFASWQKLEAHVEFLEETAQLELAIDANDIARVRTLMTRNPALHAAPLGYGKDGPLTSVAECRVPWEAPGPARLAMAEWMIAHGSDVHQGGDGPLMRAALNASRIPMMELLVAHGADVNALWHGHFPILFAPCESLDPAALEWLLDHGANPNCRDPRQAVMGRPFPGTALDYLVAGYARSVERLSACIDLLLEAGAETRYDSPAVLALLRGRLDDLAELIDAHPGLLDQRFSELDCGQTGGRLLLLQGATLLHVAAEFGALEAATLLLDRGAGVNARAAIDDALVGGQTAIFHAVTQFDDGGLALTQLLLERGADLTVRAKLPGDYERPGEIVECTALGYALLFGGSSQRRTVTLLRERGAVETSESNN